MFEDKRTDNTAKPGISDKTAKLVPDTLQKYVRDFCCANFGGFCRGLSWRIFLCTFSHKKEEKKTGDKSVKQIHRAENINPRKIRSEHLASNSLAKRKSRGCAERARKRSCQKFNCFFQEPKAEQGNRRMHFSGTEARTRATRF